MPKGPGMGPLAFLPPPAGPLGDGAAHALGSVGALTGKTHEVEVVAADADLVAVFELCELHPVAVAEDAVEAAVVEDPRAVVVAIQERVPAGDRGIVEAE